MPPFHFHERFRRPCQPVPHGGDRRLPALQSRQVRARRDRKVEPRQRTVLGGSHHRPRQGACASDRRPHRPKDCDGSQRRDPSEAGRSPGHDPFRVAGGSVPTMRPGEIPGQTGRHNQGGPDRGGRMDLRQRREGLRRPSIRQVVVVMPSAFTLGNLFFGFWAIVSAFNGNFRWAGWFIVFAGILDMLDGRVARLSGTGTRFRRELDSLVDGISYEVAPALLMYFLDYSNAGRFAWILCYIYVVAVALRLARFNVLSAGKPPSSWFTGLPSPAAGMTLAVYYPFSQTNWYRASLAYLDLQHQGLVVLMLLLAVLMVSNVKYPKFPPIGIRSAKGIFGLVVHLVILIGGLTAPEYFLFPLGLFYVTFGIVRATVLGLMERPEAVPVVDERLAEDDDSTLPPPLSHERRSRWGDRRQESEE